MPDCKVSTFQGHRLDILHYFVFLEDLKGIKLKEYLVMKMKRLYICLQNTTVPSGAGYIIQTQKKSNLQCYMRLPNMTNIP